MDPTVQVLAVDDARRGLNYDDKSKSDYKEIEQEEKNFDKEQEKLDKKQEKSPMRSKEIVPS
ncbi:MAG: hypothetical protein Q9203_001868 [Teloschistes exilis]